jgi:tRNA A-37 threonylcarbamoyl transferase component Bud32
MTAAKTANPIQQVADAVQAGTSSVLRTYKSDARSTVQLIEHEGRQYLVKQYHQPGWKCWLYHQFRATPAWREVRGARRLAAAGLGVNLPLILRHHGNWRDARQWLIFDYLPGQSLYHLMWNDAPATQRSQTRQRQRLAVARQLGQVIGAMWRAGLVNRDLKPSNLIVSQSPEDQPNVTIIDPMAISLTPPTVGACLAMLLPLLRSSYQAGGATRRERLTVLSAAVHEGFGDALDAADRHALGLSLIDRLDAELGNPPAKDPQTAGADRQAPAK